MADVEANRAAQRELYGEPLGDVLDRCRAVLGLNQSRLAVLLGISAPMLSQVMSARRIKIGNPSAVRRLQVMVECVASVETGQMTIDQALTEITGAGASGEALTGTARRTSPRETAAAVQAVFRSVASATDHLAAAGLLEEQYPAVADLLRTYGAGSLDDAATHLSRSGG
ncbi:MAG: DNA-binding protein [Aeromicrobium sp.]|uniref:helix-turn-helix domain-containing protein n=1 Tax=Aeromicrobium sp. TaxID=1871063 RepID=UPI00261169BC|nr:DNA-binding protein [Aeromicrobium sp.]MDF1705379.1 DNA-binding protein [Aeromicrobium sp.]